jgi:hypothetical protein
MKTLKEKFGQYALGQAEMQAVKGGELYSCQCNGTGTWIGSYTDQDQADRRADYHCVNGGSCTPL